MALMEIADDVGWRASRNRGIRPLPFNSASADIRLAPVSNYFWHEWMVIWLPIRREEKSAGLLPTDRNVVSSVN